jgi:hypothetical protein
MLVFSGSGMSQTTARYHAVDQDQVNLALAIGEHGALPLSGIAIGLTVGLNPISHGRQHEI